MSNDPKYVTTYRTPTGRAAVRCIQHGRLCLFPHGSRASEVAMFASQHEALHRDVPGHVVAKVWYHATNKNAWYECECGTTCAPLPTVEEAWEAFRKHQSVIRERNRAAS